MRHTRAGGGAAQLVAATEPLRVDAPRVDRPVRRGNVVATAGELVLIWFATLTLVAAGASSFADGLPLVLPIALTWFACIRFTVGAVPYALGSAAACAMGSMLAFVIVSAALLWFPQSDLQPSTLLELAVAVAVVTAAWESLAQKRIVKPRRVLLVGGGDSAAAIVTELDRDGKNPFELVGTVDDAAADSAAPALGGLAALADVVEAQKPEIVVIAGNTDPAEALDRLLDVARVGFKVVSVPHFFEHAFGRLPLQQLTPAWFMSVLHLHQRPSSRFAKRTFDVVGALVALLVAAPLFPLIALLVKLSPGPIIYRQTRLGEHGRHFEMYKFRSMRADAEPGGQARWAEERDKRVTATGRVLRQTRLDELPQLWNVLKGDMSLVGPRPERPEFLEMLGQAVPFWTRRMLVKPGLTGWAQVKGDYAGDCAGTCDKLAYDLWYLRHRNVIVDLAICAKTVSKVLLGSGAR
jgi:exopolysaccharide biosynthesis polyprenyl glycosylphosphotransferase